jgi:single-stranded-DNA-specific exonuclease
MREAAAVSSAVDALPEAARPQALTVVAEPAPKPARPTATTRKLVIPPYDFAAAQRLERELGVSHLIAQVLVRRGLADPAAARTFLAGDDAHDPRAFQGIGDALTLICRHIESRTRITIHGDYDVDGVCATAILVRALRSLGASVDWFLPSRIDDGYGLSAATIDRLAGRGTALLVTVDCGITSVEEVALARAAGIDVVVTDHHSPRADGALPDAPLVHPRVCGYPFADLCGAAVAFKLAQALGAPTANEDIEFVALATVADLVPLQGENRRLVREGLRAMANTAKPGVRALMAVGRADPSGLDAGTLGFRLAPRINAAGRIRRADAGLELLLTEDEGRAREIAVELDSANAERRAIEQRILWEAEAQVAELGERSAYVLASEGWHPGVIGIVASRIVERYHRPTVLIATQGDEGTGSGRSIPGFDLLGALHAVADELIRYGGHRAAAGLTVASERVPSLRAALEAHAAAVLEPADLVPVERVDAIVSGSELGLSGAEELSILEPCGMGNAGARLLVPGARFGDQRPMGEGRHARFAVRSGGASARAVAFGIDGRPPLATGEPVDATFRLELNRWNGVVEPRLVLRHAQPVAPAPITVLGEPADYLAETLSELDRGSEHEHGARAASPAPRRALIDRREESPLAVLADAVASGEPVLAVCAEVSRRLAGLAARSGGFSLASYHAIERDPGLTARFVHLVALDPPAGAAAAALLECAHPITLATGGAMPWGYAHLAWGEPELRFAEQMHELEYGLRPPLAALYRGLRQRGRAAGEELERLLRGDGPHGRPARLAGRLIRVLAELELVSLDRDLPALAIAGSAPTALERSPAYRAYAQRHEDGRRYLSSARAPRSD